MKVKFDEEALTNLAVLWVCIAAAFYTVVAICAAVYYFTE